MLSLLSSLGAFGGAIGNFFSNERNNRQNQNLNRANIASQEKMNAENIAFTREINELARVDAASEIQRRVADAKAAGIHPLAALGATTSSPTLAVPHGVAPRADIPYTPNNAIGDAAFAIGQMLPQLMAMRDQNVKTEVLKSEVELNQMRKAREAAEIMQMVTGSAAARAGQRSNYQQDASGKIQDSIIDPVRSTTLIGPNGGMLRTSASTTAQTVEDEYGGVAGEVYGLSRLIDDSYKQLFSETDQKIQQLIDRALNSLNTNGGARRSQRVRSQSWPKFKRGG